MNQSSESEVLEPEMSPEEIKLLDSILDRCQDQGKYFEFGAGGSTYHACMYPNIKHIVSIESSQFWINKLLSTRLIGISATHHRLQFIYIDINSDDFKHSWPKDQSKKDNWPSYSRAIIQQPQIYNIVLIDGRFRVACALHTLDAIDTSSYVLIHDYINRPQYHCIEHFYSPLTSVGTLSVFRKKLSYDRHLLANMIAKYEYICD